MSLRLEECAGHAGVRYPAQLLGDVVATLSKAQELISAPGQAEAGPVLQKSTLEAAAMGAGGAVRHEKPTPIDKKSLAKALRSAFPRLPVSAGMILGETHAY